ncbi:MAG: DUF4294 domain-containing protein [Bacteroidales bacterium]|nr:DUF4294 domain-containing protein [Bacteroidales bacterium]
MLFFVQGYAKAPELSASALCQEGDTMYYVRLPTVYVLPKSPFRTKRAAAQYNRLVAKVKKVYPYARMAAQLLQQYDSLYTAAPDDKTRKKYLKAVETQLFKEYGPQIRNLTISEGRILIKLIDRETKHTSYELIKEFKGGLQAAFWQGIARIFGNNLKDEYDPQKEDQLIEQILFFIFMGVY